MDNVVGTSGNDTIVGGYDAVNDLHAFSGLDDIDGGAGTDTLTITDADTGGGLVDLSVATVSNVEVLNVNAVADIVGNGTGVDDIDLAAFADGLTSATIKVGQGAAIVVTADTTTSLNVTNNNGVTIIGGGGTLAVDAGAAAVVVGDATPATTDANAFTSVSVKDGSTVAVTDNSGAAAVVGSKLTTVSLNKNTGAATLTGDGINTVSVTSAVAASDVTIVNTKAHTLNLTVNTVATTVEVQDDEATAVVLTTTGLTADAKGSALSLDVGKATSITVAGAGDVTLETATDDYAKLVTVTYTGSGSASADLTGATLLTTVNAATATGDLTVVVSGENINGDAVNVTGGAGDDTVTIDTTNLDTGSTVSLGAGSDTIAVSGGAQIAAGAVVDGGDDTDTLALAIVGSANVGAFKNFENFDVAGITANFDQAILDTKNTVANFVGTADTGAAVTIQNMGAGVGFIVKGDMSTGAFGAVVAADVVTLTQATAGALTITVDVDGEEGDGIIATDASFAASNATSLTVAFDNQNVDEVANLAEVNLLGTKATTLAIVSGGSEVSNKVDYTGALAADGVNDLLTAITITGDQALTLDYTKVGVLKLASVDASGQTDGGLSFDLVDLTSTGTLKLGAGDDVITGAAVNATTVATALTVQTVNGLEKGAEEGLAAQDGFDVIVVAGADATADVTAAVGVDHSITDGVYTFIGAGAANLALAVAQIAGDIAADEAVVFNFARTNYLYAEGAINGIAGDEVLVKLTGTTDIVGLDAAGAGNLYLF